MKKRVHRQQQTSQHSDSTQVTNQFQLRPFSVSTDQVKMSPDQQKMPSLQAQYERAKRFGHNIANISQSAHSPSPAHLPTGSLIQPKLGRVMSMPAPALQQPIQRQPVEQQVVQKQTKQNPAPINKAGTRIVPNREWKGRLPGFPDAKPAKPKTPVQGGGGLRRRWRDSDGNIYEWDSQHGRVEKYNKRGKHLGEFDPVTGEQTKSPERTRHVEP